MSDDPEATQRRHAAMMEFLRTCFTTVSLSSTADMAASSDDLAELSDGVMIFEALSEIAPDYFDATTIAHHLGDNWALKSSNVRKLLRNLQDYLHAVLRKDAPTLFDEASVYVNDICKQKNVASIAVLVQVLAAVAVSCDNKSVFVQRILQETTESTQVEMKEVLQEGLALLVDYDVPENEDEDNTETSRGEDDEVVFGGETQNSLAGAAGGVSSSLLFDQHVDTSSLQREIDSLKNQLQGQQQDADRTQVKFQALVEDLQDRLVKRQDELIASEEELQKVTRDLEESKAKYNEVVEQKTAMADELDVVTARAGQVHKAEAMAAAYRKKLESVGVTNQNVTDLEDQAASQVQQIMELEAELAKSKHVAKQNVDLQEQVQKLQKQVEQHATVQGSVDDQINDLKHQLSAAESTKKQYQDELAELRNSQQAQDDSDAVVTAELTEKLQRLELENKQLREQGPAAVPVAAVSSTAESVSKKVHDEATADLKRKLEAMKQENDRIRSDKDKLEAYTKRTLAKFQDKYLVALQECKAKLKEKQDKIDVLEQRSASERTAQKREERLLSSTLYELGLAILQNRLKER